MEVWGSCVRADLHLGIEITTSSCHGGASWLLETGLVCRGALFPAEQSHKEQYNDHGTASCGGNHHDVVIVRRGAVAFKAQVVKLHNADWKPGCPDNAAHNHDVAIARVGIRVGIHTEAQ